MFVSARVFWKIYSKDRTEIGSSEFFEKSEDLRKQLLLLMLWSRTRNFHIDIDVIFYPDSIFKETVTIMGAI